MGSRNCSSVRAQLGEKTNEERVEAEKVAAAGVAPRRMNVTKSDREKPLHRWALGVPCLAHWSIAAGALGGAPTQAGEGDEGRARAEGGAGKGK